MKNGGRAPIQNKLTGVRCAAGTELGRLVLKHTARLDRLDDRQDMHAEQVSLLCNISVSCILCFATCGHAVLLLVSLHACSSRVHLIANYIFLCTWPIGACSQCSVMNCLAISAKKLQVFLANGLFLCSSVALVASLPGSLFALQDAKVRCQFEILDATDIVRQSATAMHACAVCTQVEQHEAELQKLCDEGIPSTRPILATG